MRFGGAGGGDAPMNALGVAPILVGAVGGSGTRVVARILARVGFFIGAHRNDAEDSEPVMDFYNVWLRRYLACGGVLPPADAASAARDFQHAIDGHRVGIAGPETPWAVKVPRSILMLPFWRAAFPETHFIHVIRSGLDLAYSNDGNQVRMFGDLLLPEEEQNLPRPLRAMAYWKTANMRTADAGATLFGPRYHMVRFEDLCRSPVESIASLTSFMGTGVDVEQAAAEVIPPSSIDRWRAHPAAEIRALLDLGRPALERFGYLDSALASTSN